MNWVREGVKFVIDIQILSLLTWEDVEIRACGSKEIETEALKKITVYENASESH